MNLSHTVVVCTRDRVTQVVEFLENISKTSKYEILKVIIVENSVLEENAYEIRRIIEGELKLKNVTVIRSLPGLARARNAVFPSVSTNIVHFMDDDINLPIHYFEYIDSIFTKYPNIAGLAPHVKSTKSKSKFQLQTIVERILNLAFRADGTLSKSGRARWIRKARKHFEVDWLPGCCMVYRANVIMDHKFEVGLENGPLGGYALGEDLEFSHRISKRAKLLGIGEISIEHKLAPNNRTNWIKMDEGIGRLRAALLMKFPEDVRFRRIFISLLFEGFIDFVRIKITKQKTVSLDYVQFTRLRFFLRERSEPTLVNQEEEDEN